MFEFVSWLVVIVWIIIVSVWVLVLLFIFDMIGISIVSSVKVVMMFWNRLMIDDVIIVVFRLMIS